MKKILLVLFICVVINSGKELFHAGTILITKLSIVDVADRKVEMPFYSDKQVVLNILFLRNERNCP